jgi:hypothetical protein
MAYPTALNSQISDAVSQASVQVLGDAPALSLGSLYVSTAHALSNAAHNATSGQQQTNITAQAAAVRGVVALLSSAARGSAVR